MDPGQDVVTATVDSLPIKLSAALPFAAALVFLLISPLLVAKVKRILSGQIALDSARFGVTPDTQVPAHLKPECIDDYVEYVSDAVQILPLTLLPVSGTLLAIASRIPTLASVAILAMVTIGAIAAEAWILASTTPDYLSKKKFGYSVATAIGGFVNLVGLVIVLVYG